MRVANNYYKTYAELVQNLKSQYNKSMEKVYSGRKYATGADNPSAYYQGEKLENLYNDVEAKDTILGDVLHRMEQQEASSKALHTEMGNINTTLIKVANATEQDDTGIVDTVMTELKQRQNTMTQDLNLQYENYYVMGGNDSDTVPFSSNFDANNQFTMTYHHKFAGDDSATHIKMTFNPSTENGDGTSGAFTYDIVNASDEPVSTAYSGVTISNGQFVDQNGKTVTVKDASGNTIDASAKKDSNYSISIAADGKSFVDSDGKTVTITSNDGKAVNASDAKQDAALDKLLVAMREQGRMSLGYGTVVTDQRSTLPDTYFGGMNMITGLTSDQMRTLSDDAAKEQIKTYMNKSAFGLNAKAIDSIGSYQKELDLTSEDLTRPTDKLNNLRSTMSKDLGGILNEWDNSMQRVISTTRHIGVTYNTLSTMQSQLQVQQDTYQKEYDDKLGVDTADAITKMYSDQFAYNAALQVGSKIMQNSLFDFVQ
ncbi:MAG: hypothetical protein SPL94_09695 [Oribacterium sp.]|nr:hypothetical protein [Oribacterium sp.]